jgi:hypothetical protein
MRPKSKVFSVILPAVVGAFCTRRAWAMHEMIRLPDAPPSFEADSSGFQLCFLVGTNAVTRLRFVEDDGKGRVAGAVN